MNGANGVIFNGIEELLKSLKEIPDEIAEKAGVIALRVAEETAAEAREAYPLGATGNLRKGVKVKKQTFGNYIVSAKVINTSEHSHLYEDGTELRKTKNDADRGIMPKAAKPTIRSIAPRKRREFNDDLADMVEQVTGAVIIRG